LKNLGQANNDSLNKEEKKNGSEAGFTKSSNIAGGK
jgi:hypothetical protein